MTLFVLAPLLIALVAAVIGFAMVRNMVRQLRATGSYLSGPSRPAVPAEGPGTVEPVPAIPEGR